MERTIITISRQFGSLGREIGRLTAEELDIGYYDKEIMEMAAHILGVSPEFFREDRQNMEGMQKIGGTNFMGFLTSLSLNVQANEKAGELIRNIADHEDALIVGRCADWFLRDRDAIHVFICADLEDRVRRVMDTYGLSEKKARRKVQEQDRKREAFYEFVTGEPFGKTDRFDLVINTSKTSPEEAVQSLCALYDRHKGFTSLKGGFAGQYETYRKPVG